MERASCCRISTRDDALVMRQTELHLSHAKRDIPCEVRVVQTSMTRKARDVADERYCCPLFASRKSSHTTGSRKTLLPTQSLFLRLIRISNFGVLSNRKSCCNLGAAMHGRANFNLSIKAINTLTHSNHPNPRTDGVRIKANAIVSNDYLKNISLLAQHQTDGCF